MLFPDFPFDGVVLAVETVLTATMEYKIFCGFLIRDNFIRDYQIVCGFSSQDFQSPFLEMHIHGYFLSHCLLLFIPVYAVQPSVVVFINEMTFP